MLDKASLSKILFLVLFWVCGTVFIIFYDWTVISFESKIIPFEPQSNNLIQLFIIGTIITLAAGFAIASFEVLYFSKKLRRRSFGQGVLVNFLLGKYHTPREESRIFLFMDLKSSTSIAETLGHVKYSQLIQDCFYDLTDVAKKFNAQIYQYVGDEVALSWKIQLGLENGNCIQTFMEYDNLIQEIQKITWIGTI